MIILPDRNIVRTKILMPVPNRQWRSSSQDQFKDQLGNENRTRFRITARLNDGRIVWRGWLDDRADFDAFLWAIANDSLRYERALWDLPTPSWRPDLAEWLTYDFATQVFLVTPTGSNQTYTSPADWVNGNNDIHTIGAGASGGAASDISGNQQATGTGGGGGAWNHIANFSFAVPGTTTATFQIGTGGVAVTATVGVSAGNSGGDTWFNGTTLGGSSVGSKGGVNGAAAASSNASGGAGGVGASGVGTDSNDGGRGGNKTGTIRTSPVATGAGGAAGPTGAGTAGVDTVGTGGTAGGSGDAGSGGGGGAVATTGGNGSEWDATHGSGGGGGGAASGTLPETGGSGGAYGAGGAGAGVGTSAVATSGGGFQGIIYLTYAPVAFVFAVAFFDGSARGPRQMVPY